MLGSELYIEYINYLKSLKDECFTKHYQKQKSTGITLEDILDELNFGYDIINGELKLVNLSWVHLSKIKDARLRIDKNLAAAVLNILRDYLDDYILNPIVKELVSTTGVKPGYLCRVKDVLKYMWEYSHKFTNKQFLMVEAILDPAIIRIDNVIRNLKRSN